MSSITQINDTRTATRAVFSPLLAGVLSGFIVAAALASAYYFSAPSADMVLVGS